jgi:aspartate/methionine/tyrosine aminotransferase
VTPGAVAALFIVHTSLLEPSDHLVVARPNYATNVETPRAIGADVTYLDLAFEDGWAVDPDRIAALMTPRTRLVSLTTPHNPTGSAMDEATLGAVIGLVERAGARLLLDETYREMTFGEPLPVAAGLSPSVVSVSSLSKTYGLPGIRIGWLVTRDRGLRDRFLAAKEQILISGSLVDETIALHALRRRPGWLPAIRARIDEAFGMTARWLDGHDGLEWVPPRGGVVGFPRIRPEVAARTDADAFYRILFEEHATIVGPGHWFEQPRTHFRLGYGWPTLDELREGLHAIDTALAAAQTP